MRVERGLQGFQEVNRVVFDPGRVSVVQMAGWLQEAGTFIGILKWPGSSARPKDIGEAP